MVTYGKFHVCRNIYIIGAGLHLGDLSSPSFIRILTLSYFQLTSNQTSLLQTSVQPLSDFHPTLVSDNHSEIIGHTHTLYKWAQHIRWSQVLPITLFQLSVNQLRSNCEPVLVSVCFTSDRILTIPTSPIFLLFSNVLWLSYLLIFLSPLFHFHSPLPYQSACPFMFPPAINIMYSYFLMLSYHVLTWTSCVRGQFQSETEQVQSQIGTG